MVVWKRLWLLRLGSQIERLTMAAVFMGQGENPVFRITKKYVPLNR